MRRYVHGAGLEEPLVEYQGSGTSVRRFLHGDERGSIVAQSDGTGAAAAVNRHGEDGLPQAGNSGRFQFGGQAWIAEIGLYDLRARMYDPRLARFLQTDPIGYGGGMNLYAYAGGDPVNRSDPTGLCAVGSEPCVVNGQAFGMRQNSSWALSARLSTL